MSLAANSSSFTCPTEVVCSKNATLSYQNTTVVLASTPTYHLVVAFSSSDPALSQPINGTSDLTGVSRHCNVPFTRHHSSALVSIILTDRTKTQHLKRDSPGR